jgi:hypothetical protein
MRFLLEAYRRQRRRLMVEKWLLLACRCLVLALLAFALGRPLLGALGLGTAGRTVFILIDNGVASGLRDPASGRPALQRHKDAAKAVLASLRSGAAGGESDRVALIALGGPPDALVLPPSPNAGSVAALIDALEPTDSRTDLPAGLALVAGAMAPAPGAPAGTPAGAAPIRPDRTLVVVLSDFLEGSLDLAPGEGAAAALSARLPEGVRVVASTPPADAAPAGNVSIVGVEPLRSVLVDTARAAGAAGEVSELVRVQLRRSGAAAAAPAQTTVRARLAFPGDDASRAQTESPAERATVRWAPGQESATAVVPVRTDRRPAGPRGTAAAALIVAGIDDDALPADNRWRAPVELREALRVGIVAPARFAKAERVDKLEPAAWARLALAPREAGAGIDAVDVEPAALDQARLATLDAVILPRPDLVPEPAWARLRGFVESGGLVIVAPPPGVSVHLWGDSLTRAMGLDWTLERESRDTGDRALRRSAPRASTPAPGAPAAGPASAAPAPAPALLSLIEGELDELARPVRVARVLPMRPVPEHGDVLLELDDATPVLWAGPVGAASPSAAAPAGTTPAPARDADPSSRGLLVYLGVALDLDWSDLPAKPLMLPLVQELVRQGVGRARGSFTALAGSRPPVPGRTTELQELPDPARIDRDRPSAAAPLRLPPGGAAGVSEPVRRAGVWRAADDRGATRGLVVVNPDPRGTRVGPQPQAAVGAFLRAAVDSKTDAAPAAPGSGPGPVTWLASADAPGGAAAGVEATLGSVLGATQHGPSVALPLLVACLLLAVAEIFLARRASHAGTLDDAAGLDASAAPLPAREAA